MCSDPTVNEDVLIHVFPFEACSVPSEEVHVTCEAT